MYPKVEKKKKIKKKKHRGHNNPFACLVKINYFVLFLKFFHF